jgi:hypothetical protein
MRHLPAAIFAALGLSITAAWSVLLLWGVTRLVG